MKKIYKIGILACSLMILCLPMSVYAYSVNDGNIEVSFGENGSVTVNGVEDKSGNIVLEGSDTDKSVTITVAQGRTAEVTLNGLVCGDFSTSGNGNVVITLKGENILTASEKHAGLEKTNSGSLIINGRGSLKATGGNFGAGIGGRYGHPGSYITVSGNATVIATGGVDGAGIGGGFEGSGNNITVSKDAEVIAIGGWGGAGIGGGYHGSGSNITISDTSKVTVEAGGKGAITGAAGIGNGADKIVEESEAVVIPVTCGLVKGGWVKYLDTNGEVITAKTITGVAGGVHNYNKTEETDATCTEPKKVTYTCSFNASHTKTETVGEPLGHSYADQQKLENWKKDSTGHWQECVRATCSPILGGVTEKKNHTYANDESPICTVCGYDRTHKHTLTYAEAAEPTCTEAGNKAYYKCTECDSMYKDAFGIVCIEAKDVYLQPNGHKLERHASVSATCTQDGNIEYYVCETCGNFYKDADGLQQIEDMHETIIPATGHTAGDSYQSDKNNHWKICSTCGKTLDKSSHSFSGRSCTVCGYRKSVSSGGGAGSTGTMKAVTSIGTQGSWVHDEKGWWFRKTDGTYPQSGWTKLTWQGNSYWYYFNADGYMDMGWIDWNSKRYYLNPMIGTNSGRMLTGWQQIDDKWYYFSAEQGANEGCLLRSTTTPDGYRVDADGIWQQN